jgi:hypothetical protein
MDNNKQRDWKSVPLPDRVTVPVAELHRLRQDAALLQSLRQAGVEDWHGFTYAQWLNANDPDIQDIRLGCR